MSKVYTPQGAAEYMTCEVHTVLERIADGSLRAFHIGRPGAKRKTWRIREEDLEAFLEARTNRPALKPTKRKRSQSRRSYY